MPGIVSIIGVPSAVLGILDITEGAPEACPALEPRPKAQLQDSVALLHTVLHTPKSRPIGAFASKF